MNDAWYVARGEEQAGPLQWAELQKLAASSELASTDLVWAEGFTEWVAASSVRDLFAPDPSTSTAPQAVPQQPFAAMRTATLVATPSAAAVTATGSGIPAIDYSALPGARLVAASFHARWWAALVDGIIVLVIGFLLAAGFWWWVGPSAARDNAHTVHNFIRVIFITVGWIYYATLESGPLRATLGKRLFNLRVTDLAGNSISFARASGRHFGKIISQLIFMIGYLMMKFTPNSQCLHDMMAGCLVVKEEWD